MRFLATIALLLAFALPSRAETPWDAAETLRVETGRIERLFYRTPNPDRDAEIRERLARIEAAWQGATPKLGPDGNAADKALADYAAAVRQQDAANVARERQRVWAAVMAAARDQALAAVLAGNASDAQNWMNIRDYSRASRDTSAVLALKALADGQLDQQAAHDTVEAELLTVAASELRLALSRASEDAAAGHMIQYAGDIGRAEGLVAYLSSNMTARLGPDAFASLQRDLTRARSDPSAVVALSAQMSGYAPVKLSPEETLRRARLLRRFTALVWEEYKNGVRNGEISQHLEYSEALMFRDRAAMLYGDLASQFETLADSEHLARLLDEMKAIMQKRGDGVEALVTQALALIDATFGAEVAQGGYAAALDALPAALDELLIVARNGDWAEAELKRLEAYSWFDPDIEQRLVPRAPSMALRMEARFWEGTAARPGLGRLVAQHAPIDALSTELDGIKADLNDARTRIETPISAFGAVLQSGGIIFREGLEAVLILAALLAALRAEGADPARFRGPVGLGIGLALIGSFALWAAARWLITVSTLSREALEGGTALLAAAVLIWLVLGLTAKGGHVAALRRKLAGSVTVGTVALLAFLVVFREGFETVLFYEALLVDAAAGPVLLGLLLGALAVLGAGWLVLASGRRLPLAMFFRVTSVLLAVLAVMLVGAGIRGLQTAALVSATPVSWFPDRDWLQLWFGLFPVAEPLFLQGLVILLFLGTALARQGAVAART
ncbi:FTR1 family iron permease [Paracoccus aestuariivivens]|uniref:Iron permease n=1 Tax=Paracoccus aestuariivivens TaxID=1820333 RepID=A0A6L6J504_9RHOB|nr:FTR1 family protein [Paracoccus aestuariivivens]MTH76950.1 hypothetical protein [Paracoccus aestuariivivens]